MSNRSEISGIQYLRGFAAIAVVLDHVSAMAAFPKYFGQSLWNGALSKGALGVDIFFVISGFIIVAVSLKGPALLPAISVRQFFLRRAVRIIPLMWVGILSYAALRGMFTSTPIIFSEYLRALVLFPQGSVEPRMIWTLRHEFIFYIIFAISFMTGTKRWRPLLYLWFVSPTLIGLFRNQFATTVVPDAFIDILASPVNLEFCAGFILAIGWLKMDPQSNWQIPVLSPVVLLYALAITVIFVWGLSQLQITSLVSCLVLAVMNGLVVLLGCKLAPANGKLGHIANFFGDASYSIYLFHPGIASGLLAITAKLHLGLPLWIIVFSISVIVIAMTCAIHIWVEKPLVAAIKQRVPR
ncbi:acyltransferase family protein [Novosphingobium sp. KACC 22771]|uniref:acyltransferase family protein n=1 Tax=Novosphingobium sp. KACC 22771 TaxID=3025670 RepID=UPI002365BB93|nr:acyltransferase [Novosphingobium sp. KACC 22771]WDF72861.1 acyltransferase [Novosphingobium sp. KACC 22771]